MTSPKHGRIPGAARRKLHAELDLLGAGGGWHPLVWIEGKAGAGKTTLLDTLLADAPVRTARAICRPVLFEGWRPIRMLAHALGVAVPTGSSPGGGGSGPSRREWSLVHAVLEAIRAHVADAPLLIVVEDLQWASDETTRFLQRLLDSEEEPVAGLAVWLTGREAPTGIGRLLDNLRRKGSAVRVGLRGRPASPPSPVVFPERLPPAARRLLEIACLMEEPAPVGVLDAVSGLTPKVIRRSLDRLDADALLARQEGTGWEGWAPSNGGVRAAVLDRLGATRARRLRRRILDALDRFLGTRREAGLSEMVHQAIASGLRERALRDGLDLLRRARAEGAAGSGLRLAERLAGLRPSGGVREEIEDERIRLAIDRGDLAALEGTDPRGLGPSPLKALVLGWDSAGDLPRLREIEGLLAAKRGRGWDPLRCYVESRIAWYGRDVAVARAAAKRGIEEARRAGDEELDHLFLAELGGTAVHVGLREEAVRTYRRMLSLARASGVPERILLGLLSLSGAAVRSGRPRTARRLADRALRLARDRGLFVYEIAARFDRLHAAFYLGDLGGGLNDAARIDEAARDLDLGLDRPLADRLLGLVLAEAGRWREAGARMRRAARWYRERGQEVTLALVEMDLAWIEAARGRPEKATPLRERAERRAEGGSGMLLAAAIRLRGASIDAMVGDRKGALEGIRGFREVGIDDPILQVQADRIEGDLIAEADRGIGLLQRALAEAERRGLANEVGRLNAALARRLREAGEIDGALAHAERAVAAVRAVALTLPEADRTAYFTAWNRPDAMRLLGEIERETMRGRERRRREDCAREAERCAADLASAQDLGTFLHRFHRAARGFFGEEGDVLLAVNLLTARHLGLDEGKGPADGWIPFPLAPARGHPQGGSPSRLADASSSPPATPGFPEGEPDVPGGADRREEGEILLPAREPAVRLRVRIGGDPLVRPRFDWLRTVAAPLLERLLDRARRSREVAEEEVAGTDGEEIVARTEGMQRCLRQIARLAETNLPVLLQGETGTGKELLARRLHRSGTRRSGPFVAVHCTVGAEGLLESELFGHERGAFTGADRARRGIFEQADGGTLFLDEAADMPAPMQGKLLRILETGRFRRVGGQKEIRADVRIVAATHRDLAYEVNGGRFRRDLYYRLAAAVVEVPPLRERIEEIPMLLERFREGRSLDLPDETLELLCRYRWPGNVRELRNETERWFAAGLRRVEPDDLSPSVRGEEGGRYDHLLGNGRNLQGILDAAIAEVERGAIEAALRRAGGNKARAARLLGIDRTTLYRKLQRLAPDGSGKV